VRETKWTRRRRTRRCFARDRSSAGRTRRHDQPSTARVPGNEYSPDHQKTNENDSRNSRYLGPTNQTNSGTCKRMQRAGHIRIAHRSTETQANQWLRFSLPGSQRQASRPHAEPVESEDLARQVLNLRLTPGCSTGRFKPSPCHTRGVNNHGLCLRRHQPGWFHRTAERRV